MPVAIPAGVTVSVSGNTVTAKGPQGELSWDFADAVCVEVQDNQVVVTRKDDEKQSKALHGTTRSLINNMIIGVDKGYQKELEIQGVGYKAVMKGQSVVLSLGYSHEIEYAIPDGIKIELPNQTEVKISGMNKEMVGQVAARIRGFAPAEPYKGKGVRYKGERIRRKEGKAVA